MFKVPEQHRITTGRLKSDLSYGNNGVFKIPLLEDPHLELFCIASDGEGYEHVSVSKKHISGTTRIPTWRNMCSVKDYFWDEEDTVIQFHPKKSQYKDVHLNVLHLWRKIGTEYELPPMILV